MEQMTQETTEETLQEEGVPASLPEEVPADLPEIEESAVPEKGRWKLPRATWLTALLLLAAGISMSLFSLALSGREEISWGGSPLLLLFNTLPILLVLALVWLATSQAWIACLVTGVLTFLVTGGNYFKVLFRDDPLIWEDLSRIREAYQMSEQYKVELTPVMIWWIVGMAVFTVLLFFLGRGRPKLHWRMVSLGCAAVVSAGSFVFLYANDGLYTDLAGKYAGDIRQSYAATGVLYPFLHSAGQVMNQLASYDEEAAAALLHQYRDAQIPAREKVNLISIQMEAMADLSLYDIDGLSPEVYRDFHTLQEESYSGTLVTDVFAGGTIETEVAVLTGGNKHGDFSEKTNSFAWYLKSQGYTTTGAHPSRDWFYNRKVANPNLGLDDYLFTDNYYHQFVPEGEDVAYDNVFFPDLEDRLTEYFETSDAPLFSFNVTYQGHGPYRTDLTYWGSDYCTGNYEPSTLNALNNYFHLVQDSFAYAKSFTEYLDARPEPVVLLLYGDHKPWMGNKGSIYEGMGISLDTATKEGFQNYYSTWYMIWGNQAAKDRLGDKFQGKGPDLSPCFLMNEVFERIGWKGPAYMQAQRETAHRFPVLHTTGWVEEKGVLTPAPSAQAREQIETFQNVSTYDHTRRW